MLLETQIQSLIFSFVYGLFFSFLLDFHYKYIFETKLPIRIVVNLFFILDHAFLYFILLRLINHGILHIYFFFSLALGFLVAHPKTRILRSCFKKPKKKKSQSN